MDCQIAKVILGFFDFYEDEIEFLARLADYIGGEDAVWDLLKKLKPKHPSEVSQKVIEYVTTQAGWELLDITNSLEVKLVPKDILYVFEIGNPYAEFLVREGYLYDEELVVDSLTLREIEEDFEVPIFVSLDGTEYLAVEDICPDWFLLERTYKGKEIEPLRLPMKLALEEACKILQDPKRLKALLV
jgi:hypothetical protein